MRTITRLCVAALLVLGFGAAAQAQMFWKPTYSKNCSKWWLSGLDDCRDVRDGPFRETWSVFVQGHTPIPVAVCDGEEVEVDPLELARNSCNRTNTTRKKDLKECFEKGIGIKTNFDVDKACPKGNMVDTLPEDADLICDADDAKESKDGGNGFFSTCTAVGPGPEGAPNEDWKPWEDDNGCCLVGIVKNPDRGWEFWGDQNMIWDKWTDEKWTERFFMETKQHEIYMCNPSNTEDDESYTHYYCAQTSQDIMVEGWQNPEENADHQGPGWCNVTTGSYIAGGTTAVDQIFGDLAKAVQYIGEPKGIVDPDSDDRYDESDPHERYMCSLRRDAFDTHCSDAEIVDTHQFAHSMGAIAAAVWGLPFDVFGGAATGATKTVRNNCDPVPQIVDYMHPYAIYFYAKQHINTPTGGVDNYRWCNDADIVNDCVKRDGTYLGTPKGPAGCGVNGPPCEYAAWCSWDPYDGWSQEYSGRQKFAPSECPNAAGAVIDKVKECLADDGGLSKIITCLDAAYDAVDLIGEFPRAVEDHAFDDYNNWGGYRMHTGARPHGFEHYGINWDAPRTGHRGAIKHTPPPTGGGNCDDPPPPGSPLIAVCVEEEL